jgi:hypothetical protein
MSPASMVSKFMVREAPKLSKVLKKLTAPLE